MKSRKFKISAYGRKVYREDKVCSQYLTPYAFPSCLKEILDEYSCVFKDGTKKTYDYPVFEQYFYDERLKYDEKKPFFSNLLKQVVSPVNDLYVKTENGKEILLSEAI